jgi:hypothetical protein
VYMNTSANSQPSSRQSDQVLQQTQRLIAWSAYEASLKYVDQEILNQYRLTINHLRTSLWVQSGTYIVQLLVTSSVLLYSLGENLQASEVDPLIWTISLASLTLLGILIFRNPIRSLNRTMVDLTRIQIILQGYIRQINQVDAIFKQAFLEDKMDVKNVSKSLDHIQRLIDANVESLLQFLDVPD